MIALLLLAALARHGAPESHPGIDTQYGEARAPGGPVVRTIVTAPAGSGKLPGVFVVGWLSCDTVELKRSDPRGVERLLQEVVRRSGALVMRMDKPGVGDSEGDCARTDFDTELAAYRAAFDAFVDHPRLDRDRLTIAGISSGCGIAPLVAREAKVARYLSLGGWSKTWFEHMIALERRRLPLSGASDPTATLNNLAAFHAAYLFDRLTPAEVARRHPGLGGVWYDEPESQYGRPASYYHQLQSLDLVAAWSRVKAKTLIVWGEYDWIMDRSDQELLRDLTGGSLLIVPRADHVFTVHPDAKTAFQKMGAGSYPSESAARILDFLQGR